MGFRKRPRRNRRRQVSQQLRYYIGDTGDQMAEDAILDMELREKVREEAPTTND